MTTTVVFDLHETLVQLHPSTAAVLGDVIGVDPQRCHTAYQAADRRVESLRAVGAWPPPDPLDRWPAFYGVVLEALEVDADGAAVAASLTDRFRDPRSYAPFAEIPDVVVALARCGVRLGVLSNTDIDVGAVLDHHGLKPHFDDWVATFDHGLEKPDPGAFELALQRLDADPASTWFVGDSVVNDVVPAAMLGMHTVLVDRTGCAEELPAALPGHHVADLASLPALVHAHPGGRPTR